MFSRIGTPDAKNKLLSELARHRVRFILEGDLTRIETPDAKNQLLSVLARHLHSGTFAYLNLVRTFPVPAEIIEALRVSRGLRSISIPRRDTVSFRCKEAP